jgi:hypothetical protein
MDEGLGELEGVGVNGIGRFLYKIAFERTPKLPATMPQQQHLLVIC